MKQISRHRAWRLMIFCLLAAASLRLLDLNSTPPGLHYDEAANGTLAAGIGLLGERPVFISSYTGKEVLFFYLGGGLMRLVGASVFTLRLTSAFVGLVSIAATYWLGQELFNDRRISVIAAVLIGVSFWHLIFSRLGFRAITQPLLQTLTIATMFRGIRRQRKRWLIAAGIFLGLTAYTYLAARLFPVLILLATLPLLLSRQMRRLRWRQLALLALVAFVALLPLLGHFASDPDAFWVRFRQVTPNLNDPGLSFGQRYLKTLQTFFIASDPHWRFNVPEKPLFGWFWGSFLVLGWVSYVIRWRHLTRDWQRAASLLIILAPFIMVLPAAFVTETIVANNMRIIGLIPFIFFLPANGLTALLEKWQQHRRGASLEKATIAAGFLALVGSGFATYRTYFDVWATEPALYYESDGDLTDVAQFLDETDTGDATLYVSALHYRHPTLAFLSERFNEIKWLTNSEALVFPADGPSVYIYPANSSLPSWAMPFLETAERVEGGKGPDGQAAFDVFRLTESPELTFPHPIRANFDNAITLTGFDLGPTAAGTTMPVMLYWQVEDVPAVELTYFVHLQDAWQHRWSHAEPFTYPVAEWQPGETIIQRVELPVPPGTPPGVYRLRVGLFSSDTGENIPRLDAEGRYAGDAYVIDEVMVSVGAPPDVRPQPPFVIDRQVRPGLHLMGYERGGGKVATGERYYLVLWWHATASQPALNARLELVAGDQLGRILLDTQPVHGTYPFQRWQTPQFVIDHVAPLIPADFPPGDYRLNLRLMDANDETLLAADLGPLTVEATERLFEPPQMTHQLAATFGDEIELLGYEIEPTADERQITLQLAWQARAQPPVDYTVFVHLLDLDGFCCLWQQDAMPRQGQYPTSRWLIDEVVTDTYQILLPEELPSGEYPIEVGLFVAETGKRLQVVRPNEGSGDAVFLQPLQVGQ